MADINVANIPDADRGDFINECFGYMTLDQKIAVILKSFNDEELSELEAAVVKELETGPEGEDELEVEDENESEEEE